MAEKVLSDEAEARLSEIKTKLEAEFKLIGKSRDRIRELVSDAEAIVNDVDDAMVEFQSGLDKLSRYL